MGDFVQGYLATYVMSIKVKMDIGDEEMCQKIGGTRGQVF